jgi:purine-nucleoside phosphorylase
MSNSEPFSRLSELALTVPPQLAIVLGSGLATVTWGLRILYSVPFSQVPGLITPSVPGHAGRLTLCEWCNKRVLIFEGRLHFYEGHSWDVVTKPIRIAHSLGARTLLATNAAGGIHPRLAAGTFMAIRDHMDWTRSRAWPIPTIHSLAPAGPSPCSSRLLHLIQEAATKADVDLFTGIYAGVIGPNYETPAEIRALQKCGADAVGMSTAREIQVAFELGMECAAISCITNRAAGLEHGAGISHQEVIQNAKASCGKLTILIEAFLNIYKPEDGSIRENVART